MADEALIRRLDGHFLAAMATAGGGGRLVRLEGAVALANSRVDSTMLNFLLLREVDASRLPLVLAQGAALLAEFGRPAAAYLSPLSGDLPALRRQMEGLGWRRRVVESVLFAPVPARAPATAAGVTVDAIGSDQLPLWLDLLTEGYGAGPDGSEQIKAAWSTLMRDPGPGAAATFYIARLQGQAAGTGLLWQQGATAGLYCGAVRPALRRRGVETALIARRLLDAAAQGATGAVLQTEVNGPVESLCTDRFGFERVYQLELWLPPR